MIGKVLVLLLAALAVSVFVNYTLLQSNRSLGEQNEHLAEQIVKMRGDMAQVRQQADLQDEAVQEQPQYDLTPGSMSITAVAVRPVLTSDGFFQNVSYEGTAMSIRVDIRNGTGLILVNTAVPTGVDFQTSAKTAVKVAQQYTNADLGSKDIIFSITSKNDEDLQAVDGPSAGMAMAVLLVSEIQNKEISDRILLTGTIGEDGSMGPVGGIFEKAEAAAKHGAETFIVPSGLGITHVQQCEESREGPFLYRSCRSEAKPLSPIMEEKYGMRVVEASDLMQVLDYFD